LANIELSFHPCNILRDSRKGIDRGNKNVGCGTWKRRFFTFVDHVKTNKHMFEFFSPSGSHTILVYRSYTDTKHARPLCDSRASCKFQRNFTIKSRTACRQRPRKKRQISIIQDSGRPPFWKYLNRHISVKNCSILMKFGTLQQILNSMLVSWPSWKSLL